MHRAPPKQSNPHGPCSTVVRIGGGRAGEAGATLDSVLKHVSKVLGFPAARLQVAQTARHVGSDSELAALPDGTLVDVFEAGSDPRDTAAEAADEVGVN